MKLNSVLNHNTKQLVALLSEKTEAMEEVLRKSLSQSLNSKMGDLRQEIEAEMGRQQKIIQTINNLAATVMDTKGKLKALEERLSPRPKATMYDKPQRIKGIGPRLAQKLKVMGITTVGELITADPMSIAVGVQISEDKAKALQARAKMLMIPGLDKKQVDLLEQMVIPSK